MTKKKIIDFRFTKKNKQQDKRGVKDQKHSFLSKKIVLFTLSAVLIGVLIGGILFVVYQRLSSSDFFQITSVKVKGSIRLDRQKVMELSGLSFRSNILAIDAGSIKQKLENNDWIESAKIKRYLPSELLITIKERVPAALVNSRRGLFFLDRKGKIFAQALPPEDLDFPVITGLETEVDAGNSGDWSSWLRKKEQIKKVLTFVGYSRRGSSALPRQNISEINMAESDKYVLFLADKPFPIYMGKEVSKKKYYRLARVLYWLYKKRELSDVNFIRMDYMNNKVLVGKNKAG